MSSKQYAFTDPVADTGYVEVCYHCSKRFGGPVFGEREVSITKCDKCQGKLTNREMLERGINHRDYKRKQDELCDYADASQPV